MSGTADSERPRVFVGLGSNLGPRAELIHSALVELGSLPLVRVRQASRLFETAPVGGPSGQGPFLNACAELVTELGPRDLLGELHGIERRHGRQRGAETRNGPRTLDLDLLLYGRLRLDEPGLCLPHPRMEKRLFVLLPLAELAPDWILEGCQRSVRARADELLDKEVAAWVRPFSAPART